MVRVLIFGTHPKQFNGYSKVIYELCKRLAVDPSLGIEIGIFGFQNYPNSGVARQDLPENVFLYDAYANEEPKAIGFGIEKIHEAVEQFKPDVCVLYNDLLIITNCLNKLCEIADYKSKFKIVTYIDQVYLHQKKGYLDIVNQKADAAIMFTDAWKETIVEQGLRLPSYVLEHGFDASTYYPIPKAVARTYLGLKQEDFLVLNLNRNQPRKRWDTCLKAFAEIVSRHPGSSIKLIIGTALQGAWDLVEIYERELKKRGLTLEEGLKHVVVLDNPQKLTDYDVNILYNVADIGINTCDGEGFGLCNFEQAAIGVPQIVPRLGGFLDYFNDDNSMLVEPSMAYYVDTTRDHVCGEALLCSYTDFVAAFEVYYEDRVLIEKHGKACREQIPAKYSWDLMHRKFASIIQQIVAPPPPPPAAAPAKEVKDAKLPDPGDVTVFDVPTDPIVASGIEKVDTAFVHHKEDEAKKKKKKEKKGKKKCGGGGNKEKGQEDEQMDVQAELVRMRATIEQLLKASSTAK